MQGHEKWKKYEKEQMSAGGKNEVVETMDGEVEHVSYAVTFSGFRPKLGRKPLPLMCRCAVDRKGVSRGRTSTKL